VLTDRFVQDLTEEARRELVSCLGLHVRLRRPRLKPGLLTRGEDSFEISEALGQVLLLPDQLGDLDDQLLLLLDDLVHARQEAERKLLAFPLPPLAISVSILIVDHAIPNLAFRDAVL